MPLHGPLDLGDIAWHQANHIFSPVARRLTRGFDEGFAKIVEQSAGADR
jgi:hypothetical protein